MSESKGGPAKGEPKKGGALRMAADAGARMRALMGSPTPEEPSEMETRGVVEEPGSGGAAEPGGLQTVAVGDEPTDEGTNVSTDVRSDVPSNVPTAVRTDVGTEARPDVRTLQDYVPETAGGEMSVSEPPVAPFRAAESGVSAPGEPAVATAVREKRERPLAARPQRPTAPARRTSTSTARPSPRTEELADARTDVSTLVRSNVGTDVRTLQDISEEEFERRMAAADERWKDQDITVVAVRVPAALNSYMDRYVSRINECDPKRRYRKQDAVFEAFAAFFASHPMPPAPEDEFG